ncbi:unnamed protein product [Ceratitis capitata]|uniref:Aspartyl-tRNA synthetase n=1 Tax=Ceratitis capitata TaxID=7213 RepID=A0A811VJ40_CERCA|nr:unnamed protein product [Ceratitis capitata]
MAANGEEAGDAVDVSAGRYGSTGLIQSKEKFEERKFVSPTEYRDQVVWVRGRVHTSRAKGKQCFLVLRQQSSTVQCILAVNERVSKQMVKFSGNVSKESIIDVQAKVVAGPIRSNRVLNKQLNYLFVVSLAKPQLPLQIEDASRPDNVDDPEGLNIRVNQDTRLDNRILDLRTPANQAIFRLEAGVCRLFRDILTAKDLPRSIPQKLYQLLVKVAQTYSPSATSKNPLIWPSTTSYINKMAIAADFDKVYTVGAVFRAEDSNTHRHLTEFVGLDLEMAFKYHYHEVLHTIADTFTGIFKGFT